MDNSGTLNHVVGRNTAVYTAAVYEDRKAAERRKLHNARVGVMAFLVASCCALGAYQVAYTANGAVSVRSDGYTVLKDDTSDHKSAVAAVTKVSEESKKIDIEIPEICPVNMTAYSPIAIVYDKTTGKVLYSKNETEKCYPASTAKLMTAAVALDIAPDSYNFIAGNELDLVPENASLAKINKCYSLNRQQLADGIILIGGSDVSYTAAANIGRLLSDTDDISADKAVSEFVDMMNTTARNIGAESTHFTNPDGFYDDDNYTTAKDMLKIAIYASDHDEIMDAAGRDISNGKLASGQYYEWLNTNKLVLEDSSSYYEYATGLKTGMTEGAGYCIAATAERYGHELICVVMNSDSGEHRQSDVTNLFDLSFEYIDQNCDAEEETEDTGETEESSMEEDKEDT